MPYSKSEIPMPMVSLKDPPLLVLVLPLQPISPMGSRLSTGFETGFMERDVGFSLCIGSFVEPSRTALDMPN